MKPALFALALLDAITSAATAAPNDGILGPYARVEVGRTHFNPSATASSEQPESGGNAAKLFGGYRFTEHLGVELGYAALGSFRAGTVVNGSLVQQDTKARSVFGAATGRMPLNESFALLGRLGVSHGKVSSDVAPEGNPWAGSKRSALFGLGAEYRPNSSVSLTLNYDSYGRLSNQLKANSVLFGFHFTL
jgi:OmpA-OmpF porin, OOP family